MSSARYQYSFVSLGKKKELWELRLHNAWILFSFLPENLCISKPCRYSHVRNIGSYTRSPSFTHILHVYVIPTQDNHSFILIFSHPVFSYWISVLIWLAQVSIIILYILLKFILLKQYSKDSTATRRTPPNYYYELCYMLCSFGW